MSQNSFKTWPLLVLCSIFYAMLSFMILMMGSPDVVPILRTFVHGRTTPDELGVLALAGGICTIAASIWNSRANSWLLVMNGAVCCVLGLIIALGATRPVAFRTLALLIVVMALSIGIYELTSARTLRGHLADEWLLSGAALVSVGFATVFLGFVLGWIRLEPSPSAQTFNWLGSFFAFSAICMLGLAFGHFRPRMPVNRTGNDALPTA